MLVARAVWSINHCQGAPCDDSLSPWAVAFDRYVDLIPFLTSHLGSYKDKALLKGSLKVGDHVLVKVAPRGQDKWEAKYTDIGARIKELVGNEVYSLEVGGMPLHCTYRRAELKLLPEH